MRNLGHRRKCRALFGTVAGSWPVACWDMHEVGPDQSYKARTKGKVVRNSRYFIFDKDSHECQVRLVEVKKRSMFAASFTFFCPCFLKLQNEMIW